MILLLKCIPSAFRIDNRQSTDTKYALLFLFPFNQLKNQIKLLLFECIHQNYNNNNKWKKKIPFGECTNAHSYLVLNVVNLILPFIYVEKHQLPPIFCALPFNHIDLTSLLSGFCSVSSFVDEFLPFEEKLKLKLNMNNEMPFKL